MSVKVTLQKRKTMMTDIVRPHLEKQNLLLVFISHTVIGSGAIIWFPLTLIIHMFYFFDMFYITFFRISCSHSPHR